MKNRVSARTNLIFTVVCTVIAIAIILGVLYLCGIRYVKYNFRDGFSVKFIGITDISGYPKDGRLSYSGSDEVRGLTATVSSKDKKIVYSNGDVYEGEMQDLVKHGRGKLTFENGDVYEGTFIADKMSGEGVLTFKNGDRYEGTFKAGVRSGSGTYTYSDGSVYTGEFADGLKNGKGTFTAADKSTYTGEYKNNLKHGKGTYTLSGGEVYSGRFEHGQIVVGEGNIIDINGIK